MKKVLSIAGSDSGGGAGIQADLKTFAAFRVYGTTAITSVTAQNTVGVEGVYDLPPDFVALQIDAVMKDIGADAVKTGMLSNVEIVEAVCSKLKEYDVQNLVVDPVMVAKSGDTLLREDAINVIKEKLFPLAKVITPNLDEAKVLTGLKEINDEEGMKEAAKLLKEMGPQYVLVKGGHLTDDAVDLLYDGTKFYRYPAERIITRNTHGTGCTYSAAIAACLALGLSVPEAVERSKKFITTAIKYGLQIGKGHGPTHHFAELYGDAE
ncbi:MAG TPA: bifunctional hydroxymethylpyrimidine kinase/phosphomethylpyrimidine kinase [Peptococcaceae bacterium]|nr:MAG: Phosphomethylpyrimidine kinase [Clostridia bacterium 41_269]HBT20084.1 bifunctional hydroxymethylpyrimidine kinase/phosphomethylpyrimidine kinase [Peptococcaceae bacterium]